MMTLQCVEKVFININAQMFQLKQKILGDGNLKYISDETKARVTLRGRGSDFIEASGSESNEPMHLFIEHSNFKGVGDAKALVKNLLETVQQDLAMQNGQQNCQAPAIQPQSIIQSQNQQIALPSSTAVLSVPPPAIIQNNNLQPTHIIQQQNFIPQQQIIPQNVQFIQTSMPPPSIRTGLMQFQQPTTNLQQANIQIQGTQGQQILLNQAPAHYQLQYIQQPSQQNIIQGILQPGANGQQYITVQGNIMLPSNQPQNINTIFQQPSNITMNQEDVKNDQSSIMGKNDKGQKNEQRTIVTNIPINQPPPILSCPPPQIPQLFNQPGNSQNYQQFIVNANSSWSPQQQQQQNYQIVTQTSGPVRSGNEILLQNPTGHSQQQVLTSFNPQQHIQIQNTKVIVPPAPQIGSLFHEPGMNQPSSEQQFHHQNANYQFQKQIQRPMKRKHEEEANNGFQKIGIGQNADRSSPPNGTLTAAKNRLMAQSHQKPPPVTSASTSIMRSNVSNANNYTSNGASLAIPQGMPNNRKPNNKPMASKVNSPASAERKDMSDAKVEYLKENPLNDPPPTFMLRSGTQNYRFNSPQNFISQQQPPPGYQMQSLNHYQQQNTNFNGPPRGVQMPNNQSNMYQMTAPPQAQDTSNHYQPHQPGQTMNRFNFSQHPPAMGPRMHEAGNQGMMPNNYQQQQPPQRFRQW